MATVGIGMLVNTYIHPNSYDKYHDEDKSITMNWIQNNLKERNFFIKTIKHFSLNNKTYSDTNYYNAYLSNNELLIPIVALDKSGDGVMYDSIDVFVSNHNNCINKPIDDLSVWENLDIDNIKIDPNSQFCRIKYVANRLNSKPMPFNTILRKKSKSYKYLYCGFYIENNTIKHEISDCYIKEQFASNIENSFLINEQKYKISLKNKKLFTFDSKVSMRRVGSIGTLLIDPIGFIFGYQAYQNSLNQAIIVEG